MECIVGIVRRIRFVIEKPGIKGKIGESGRWGWKGTVVHGTLTGHLSMKKWIVHRKAPLLRRGRLVDGSDDGGLLLLSLPTGR